MSLLRETVKHTNKTVGCTYWVLMVLCMGINAVPTYFLGCVNGDDPQYYIKAYVAMSFLSCFIDNAFRRWTIWISADIMDSVSADGIRKYERMTPDSKNKEPPSEFKDKLDSEQWAVCTMFEWGFSTVANLVVTVVGVAWIFYKENLMDWLMVLIIINSLSQWFIARPLRHEYTKKRRDRTEKNQEIVGRMLLLFERLGAGENVIDLLLDIRKSGVHSDVSTSASWLKISNITTMTNKLPLLMFVMIDMTPIRFFLLISVFEKFSGALSNLSGFANQYQNLDLKHDSYIRALEGKEYIDKAPDNLETPQELKIKKCVVKREKYKLIGPRMTIKRGDKILIRGESGGGKSTFIDALLGRVSGVVFADGQGTPTNYFWQVALFYQKIKETLPSNKVTIRMIMGDETNNEAIEEAMELAGCLEWANKLEPHKPEREIKMTTFSDVVESIFGLFGVKWKSHVVDKDCKKNTNDCSNLYMFDRQINKRISGGEKTRLALAMVLHSMIKKGKKTLVLDEFEQGLDSGIAYEILRGIFERFPDKTIIVVSHLERVEEDFKWNKVIKVEKNGNRAVVSVC